jgi:subtilisin family serine protease
MLRAAAALRLAGWVLVSGALASDPAVGAMRYGRAQVLLELPATAEAREAVLAARAQLESLGMFVAADGAFVLLAPFPASGWTVQVGDRRTSTARSGRFQIDVADDAPAGELRRFRQANRRAFVLQPSQLSLDPNAPTPLVLPISARGACGMSPTDHCAQHARAHGADRAPSGSLAQAIGRSVRLSPMSSAILSAPPASRPRGNPKAPPPYKHQRELGSYPSLTQQECLDEDGPAPGTTTAGIQDSYLYYLGSTCWQSMAAGCCLEENTEYGVAKEKLSQGAQWLIGILGEQLQSLVPALSDPLIAAAQQQADFTFGSCYPMHRGRYCQELTKGDLLVVAPGETCGPQEDGYRLCERDVQPGETIELTFHNNGCFGDTGVEIQRHEIPGELVRTDFYPAEAIEHWDREQYEANVHTGSADGKTRTTVSYDPDIYQVDRILIYAVPKDACKAGVRYDDYLFTADGTTEHKRFRLVCGGTPPPPDPPRTAPPQADPVGDGVIHIGTDPTTWCQYNPDDPRDISIPAVTAPPAIGSPGFGVPIEPLRVIATQLWRWIQTLDPGPSRQQAEQQLATVIDRIETITGSPPAPEPTSTTPSITIYVKAKPEALSAQAGADQSALAGQAIKLFPADDPGRSLPTAGGAKPQDGFDRDPVQGVTNAAGELTLETPADLLGLTPQQTAALETAPVKPALSVVAETAPSASLVLEAAGTDVTQLKQSLPESLRSLVSDSLAIGQRVYLTLTFAKQQLEHVTKQLATAADRFVTEVNACRDKQPGDATDHTTSRGSWGQAYDDQWAIRRVGILPGDYRFTLSPVVVAVIDTGLDWNHLDFDWRQLWSNPREVSGNGRDDDQNGFVDDQLGWDFVENDNTPWDDDGHGTIVSGIIAATRGNRIGIDGINPAARIMVLRALDEFGHARASLIAKAIVYAADHGARIINLSVGGATITRVECAAVEHARRKGVLIVAAAGNDAATLQDYAPAGIPGVLTVAATDPADTRGVFSNWGPQVELAAPGIDVLSLRARRTDTMRDIPGVTYLAGANVVGSDRRYYRASGTSFAAPIVAGIASLLVSKDPSLTLEELERVLLHSARDIDVGGIDQFTGYGLVDAASALAASRSFFIEAHIEGVRVVQQGQSVAVEVLGTADAERFASARLELGPGDRPAAWTAADDTHTEPVRAGVLGRIAADTLKGSPVFTLRIVVKDQSGRSREARFRLALE